MNALPIVKMAVSAVVSAGAGAVVGNAIKASTPLDLKTTQKVSIAVGGFVLSGLVASLASKHTEQQIDTTIEQVKTLKDTFRKKN